MKESPKPLEISYKTKIVKQWNDFRHCLGFISIVFDIKERYSGKDPESLGIQDNLIYERSLRSADWKKEMKKMRLHLNSIMESENFKNA